MIIWFLLSISPEQAAQVALRRQQQSSHINPSSGSQLNSMEYIEKIQNMENLLAQKRAYQKQLKSIQQSTYNKSVINRGECFSELLEMSFNFAIAILFNENLKWQDQ